MGKNKKIRKLGGTAEWIVPMAVVVLILFFLRAFVFDVNVVHGTSMCTTLYSGDVLLAERYHGQELERGDIITAYLEERDEWIIKRVVGLPGETIHIDENGLIYADGELIDSDYQYPAVGIDLDYNDITLGADEYYVMGDNRYDSYDSRYFGPVQAGNIRNVVRFRFYPITCY